jgi:hypothetical protein
MSTAFQFWRRFATTRVGQCLAICITLISAFYFSSNKLLAGDINNNDSQSMFRVQMKGNTVQKNGSESVTAFNATALNITTDHILPVDFQSVTVPTDTSLNNAAFDREKRYCELGQDPSTETVFDDCYQLLHPILNVHRNYNGADELVPNNWLLFGDSTVQRIFTTFPPTRTCSANRRALAGGCNTCKSLTLSDSIEIENWKTPNVTLGEGPGFFLD